MNLQCEEPKTNMNIYEEQIIADKGRCEKQHKCINHFQTSNVYIGTYDRESALIAYDCSDGLWQTESNHIWIWIVTDRKKQINRESNWQLLLLIHWEMQMIVNDSVSRTFSDQINLALKSLQRT